MTSRSVSGLKVALLVACFLVTCLLGSTTARRNRPEFPVDSEAIREALLDALEEAKGLYAPTEEGMKAGTAVAVDIGGGLTVQVGHGHARRAEDTDGEAVLADEYTRYFFGSNTKTVTAALVLKYLQEEMISSLDDNLASYLPDELAVRYAHAKQITLTDLLRHTSGLEEYAWFQGVNVTEVWTMEELALHGPAGDEPEPPAPYEYCNTNYLLLGLICRILAEERDTVVLEQPLYEDLMGEFGESAEALQSWEFPLEFHWSYENASFAYKNSDGAISNVNSPPNSKFSPSLPSSAGNILSRPYDMVKFYHRLFGARDLIPSQYVDMMLDFGPNRTQYGFAALSFDAHGAFLNDDDNTEYLRSINVTAYGHDGKWLGWRSYCLYIPELQLSFAFACNYDEYPALEVAMVTLSRFLETFEYSPSSSASSSDSSSDAASNDDNSSSSSLRVRWW
ncbi:Serine hydrolase [Balamuthia mandrillaris]